MAAYWVGFDGKWQERFDYLDDAEEWAEAVALTDRLVWVAQRRMVRGPRLLSIHPAERSEEGKVLWKVRAKIFGPSNFAPYGGGF